MNRLVAINWSCTFFIIAAICPHLSSSVAIHQSNSVLVKDKDKSYHETEMRSIDVALQNQEVDEYAVTSINKWKRIAHWKSNAPGKLYKQKATSVTIHANAVNKGTKEQLVMMVMVGGKSITNGYINNITWMYDYKINSWKNVTVGKPYVYKGHSLVTLCNDTVVLFGGVRTDGSLSNETWIFQASNTKWNQIFPSTGGNTLKPRHRHSAATLKSPNSTFNCQDSMFVYGGLDNNSTPISELWELRRQLNGTQQWSWVKRGRSKFQTWPSPGFSFLAASDHSTSMYLYGGMNSSSGQYMHKLWNMTLTASGDAEWTVISKGLQKFSPGYDEMQLKGLQLQGLTAEYMTIRQESNYFVVCCPIYVFDFNAMMWISPPVLYEAATQAVPCLNYPSSAVVNHQLVIFGGSLCSEGNIVFNHLWNLTLANTRAWLWEQKEPPLTGPLRGRGGMAADIDYTETKLYVYGGLLMSPFGYEFLLSDRSIWIFDIREKMWTASLMPSSPPPLFGQTGTMVNKSFFVVGGKDNEGYLSNTTWIFNDDKSLWTSYPNKIVNNRMWHSSVRTDNDTLIIFGGLSYKGNRPVALNDTWQLTAHSGSNVQDNLYQWKQLKSKPANLSGRYGHTAVIISHTMVVYGGTESADLKSNQVYNQEHCCSDVWMYDILTEKWKNATGKITVKRCLHSAATIGTKMIIVGGCSMVVPSIWNGQHLTTCGDRRDLGDMWVFTVDPTLLKIVTWQKLAVSNWIDSNFLAASLLPWANNILFLLGGFPATVPPDGDFYDATTKAISVIRPGCNPGYVTVDFSKYSCHRCADRHYPNAARNGCTLCPQGLTIPHNAHPVTGPWNCSKCINDTYYCQSGQCIVDDIDINTRKAHCTCSFGFVNRYGDPSDEVSVCKPIYLAEEIGGVVAIVLVISLIIIAVRLARRHFKQVLENRESELRDLANIWVIDSRELKLLDRIDSNAPGGYGDVYRAEYREFIVAVKKLQDPQRIDECEREFEREIQFMRTVRHPNIVLFLGGGRFHDDGCPFLVLEYMSKGSLGAVLINDSINISDDQKIRFSLDAAKGMKFLHGLSPPRVHRDLKSNNLLLSKHWVVKVADFGSARLIREDRPLDDTASGEFSKISETNQLLPRNSRLSIGVGTAQWSAPELLSGQIYGRPVDVYSFGIVLWEVWTRKIPYDDAEFQTTGQLRQAVSEGLRPPVPEDCPRSYGRLMQHCWDCEARRRPSFESVVEKLEKINDRFLITSTGGSEDLEES